MPVFVDTNLLVHDIGDLLAWRPIPVGVEMLEAGWLVEDRFGLSCWDALIVAAARIAWSTPTGCDPTCPRRGGSG